MNRKVRATKEIDGTLHFYCKRCDEWKPKQKFHVNNRLFYGIHTYCKNCNNPNGDTDEDRTKYKKTKKMDDMKNKTIVDGTITILKNMGYDIDKDISEQFFEKMKDKYNVDLS